MVNGRPPHHAGAVGVREHFQNLFQSVVSPSVSRRSWAGHVMVIKGAVPGLVASGNKISEDFHGFSHLSPRWRPLPVENIGGASVIGCTFFVLAVPHCIQHFCLKQLARLRENIVGGIESRFM